MSVIYRLIKPTISNRSTTINLIRHFCSWSSNYSDDDDDPYSKREFFNVEWRTVYCERLGTERLVPFRRIEVTEDVVLSGLESADPIDDAMGSLKYFRMIEWYYKFKHTRHTYSKLFEILVKASKLDHATLILMEMAIKGLLHDDVMFVALIDLYGKKGNLQELVQSFRQLTELGVVKSVNSYNALFKVVVRHGKYRMAERYYRKMIEEGIAPTINTYNMLFWVFLRCGKAATANRFYEDMKSRGITPNVVTYNTFIYGFFRMMKIGDAEKFFTEMKGSQVAPTVITYNTMIKGYLWSGKVQEAVRMFEEMKGFGISPVTATYTTLLPALCDAMIMSETDVVFKDMVERRICPNDNSMFVKLLTCQCKSGNLDVAYGMLKAMIGSNIPTEAGHYGILIEEFCKTGAYDRAEELLDEMMDKENVRMLNSTLDIPKSALDIEPSSYNTIIEYLCDNGKTKRAHSLFLQLLEKGVRNPLPIFVNLYRGHTMERNWKAAFAIQKSFIRAGIISKSDSYKLVITSFLKKGKPDYAQDMLESWRMSSRRNAKQADTFARLMMTDKCSQS